MYQITKAAAKQNTALPKHNITDPHLEAGPFLTFKAKKGMNLSPADNTDHWYPSPAVCRRRLRAQHPTSFPGRQRTGLAG